MELLRLPHYENVPSREYKTASRLTKYLEHGHRDLCCSSDSNRAKLLFHLLYHNNHKKSSCLIYKDCEMENERKY
jgi:hypothetical protein